MPGSNSRGFTRQLSCNEPLARLDLMEAQAWTAWEGSKQPAESTRTNRRQRAGGAEESAEVSQ